MILILQILCLIKALQECMKTMEDLNEAVLKRIVEKTLHVQSHEFDIKNVIHKT